MKPNPFSTENLDAFDNAAQSLKLYRRAELVDVSSDKIIIDSLYVDPLPNDSILKTLLKSNTTFLIGRKGTGKSTLFQRLQSELRKSQNKTSAYVDIKTVFESSQMDPQLASKLSEFQSALPQGTFEKLLLYREFIHAIIVEIKREIQKRIDGSLWEKIKEKFNGNKKELFEGLDNLLEDIKEDKFQSVLGIYASSIKKSITKSEKESAESKIGAEVSQTPKIGIDNSSSLESFASNTQDNEYSDILLRSFDIRNVINQLKEILEEAKIRNLYVLIDDFSELPETAMKIVVDVLLTPLNNWSNELIKFKVAAYPNRIYYGGIDKSKIDEIYLDLFKLYGNGDISRMEESAIDFTKRLVESRFKYYCKFDFKDIIEEESLFWQNLFQASMANPRILGTLLHYMYESHLIRGKRIGLTAIGEASERYYIEKIEPYFSMGKFLHESFEERSSIYSLKELMEKIIEKSRELRTHRTKMMEKIHGTPPTSHFNIPTGLESIFSTLELNFFLTKYFEMKNRDGNFVHVYALNFGLCKKYSIRFGRPTGEREFRLYFIERIFDYSPIIQTFLSNNQEILCNACDERYSFEDLPSLKFYHMKCRKCGGQVEVQNLSRKYHEEISRVNESLLLPQTELGILQTLHTEKKDLRAGYIAAELDCSHQLIGKRARNLGDLKLINKKTDRSQTYYEILPKAEELYFGTKDEMDLNDSPETPEENDKE